LLVPAPFDQGSLLKRQLVDECGQFDVSVEVP
jgi:hypothetical protein